MAKNYKAMSNKELWEIIEDRFGDETRSIFEDKSKLQNAINEDDGLLAEHFDRISRGN